MLFVEKNIIIIVRPMLLWDAMGYKTREMDRYLFHSNWREGEKEEEDGHR